MVDNDIFELKNMFLDKIGSSWLYDSLYLFLITPLGILGTFLNSISFLVFLKKNLRQIKFYQYYQVYALTGVSLSFIQAFSFMVSPRYLFELSISRSARIFKCLIEASYVMPLFLFYSNALNILLNIERASNFTDKLKFFKKISPYSACFILFILCFIINLPMFFLIDTASNENVYEALATRQKAVQFKGLCVRNQNSLNLFGIIATWFGFVVKDLIAFSLDIASNVLSIIFFKR
jgi:hypothetical protein